MVISPNNVEKVQTCFSWPVTVLWSLAIFLLVPFIYLSVVSLFDIFSSGGMFLNALTPKFYVALTGTSSFLSGLILIFEWWYFKKYGTSFIEQISLTHIYPLLGGSDEENDCDSVDSGRAHNGIQGFFCSLCYAFLLDCKVSRNPYSLFRGAEYQRAAKEFGHDPLTYYDMNLSAQDHQTFFICEADAGKPEYECKVSAFTSNNHLVMQMAWRERNPEERIKKAREALAKNPDYCGINAKTFTDDYSTIIFEPLGTDSSFISMLDFKFLRMNRIPFFQTVELVIAAFLSPLFFAGIVNNNICVSLFNQIRLYKVIKWGDVLFCKRSPSKYFICS
ncbi:Suppressor of tumorigenicity protein [Echinococcus granulosus]|uniref:Protein ST7 homolog n=1 Tax=Echinococcus granulosus TaxID=6210 RepID=W6U3V2_ECHGR|nr:Suppressor of tumorigenicity protein [Echinococcus granulosus]EUB55788.1 Suppressor of tumorigenicity protein [Echinococcus granulosus]